MVTIRPATSADEASLGRYGGALMRQHHADDPRRFIHVDRPEPGYGRFLVSQIAHPESLVLVAEHEGAVVGYLFADVERTNWMELRGPCGVIHDIYVDESARQLGAGRGLMQAAVEWIHAHGRSQVVLMTKTKNESAQRLFARFGFRPTMIEMTMDQEDGGAPA